MGLCRNVGCSCVLSLPHYDVESPEYVPAAACAAPDTVIEFVPPSPAGTCPSPAGTCAAPAPLSSDYVDSSPAASVTRAEATFEISGADGGANADLPAEVQPVVDAVVPESTDVTER